MDIIKEQKKIPWFKSKKILMGIILLIIPLFIVFYLFQPNQLIIAKDSIVLSRVLQGNLERKIAAPGTLIPLKIQWITAQTNGTVTDIHHLAGENLELGTLLIELDDLDVVQEAEDSAYKLAVSEAQLQALSATLEGKLLQQQSEVAKIRASYKEAKLRVDAQSKLAKEHIVSELAYLEDQLRQEQYQIRFEIEKKILQAIPQSNQAQLNAQIAKINQLTQQLHLKQKAQKSLQVTTLVSGVLQDILVELGQRVTKGEVLAKIVQPEKLKAELRVAETQAKDIELGQQVSVDTRNGKVLGRIKRIDPSVENGTVTIDVHFFEKLPKGARPDLRVEGIIQIEKLENILYVNRPVNVKEHNKAQLFVLNKEGNQGNKKMIHFGRSTLNQIEIISGANEGEIIVVSDMTQVFNYQTINIE